MAEISETQINSLNKKAAELAVGVAVAQEALEVVDKGIAESSQQLSDISNKLIAVAGNVDGVTQAVSNAIKTSIDNGNKLDVLTEAKNKTDANIADMLVVIDTVNKKLDSVIVALNIKK